jgi:gliding motility associated protien GldN
MNLFNKIILSSSLICVFASASAQILDGVFIKENAPNQRPPRYTNVLETDVQWAKRVWRTVDMREKVNQPFYYPVTPLNDRMSLFDLLRNAIVKKEITAYGNAISDDEFRVPMNEGEIAKMFTYEQDGKIMDALGNDKDTVFNFPITSEMVTQFWIKEDWYYNKKTSTMEVRIIGICPIKEVKTDKGEFKGYSPMCWIYFPEARPLLARAEAYISNDGDKVTFDELLTKRRFNGMIHKESNIANRSIIEYSQDLPRLLEGERIKEKMTNYEHDLWHF